MSRAKSAFACQACGARASKWTGQCAECGEWNTLIEVPARQTEPAGRQGYAGRDDARVQSASEVQAGAVSHQPTGIAELDRVLGGGLVPGSVILLGGDPGIGKSTLLLQALACLVAQGGTRALYVTGEESLDQVILRARRLGLEVSELRLLAHTRIETVLEAAAAERPGVLVIDSVQAMFTDALQSAPGSVAQVREGAARLVRFAKASGCALFLVGHVTKEGAIAGPRVLEHMVDAVLYFESEQGSRFRVIRAVKNRFGAANELGIFAMTGRGLREVSNPSAIFLSGQQQDVPGSVVMVTREGTRPLLVELQALVDEAAAPAPRRVSVGFDANRLAMLLAVLNRHAGVGAHRQDVFVNVVGGVRVGETAADLAVVLAVLSSMRTRAVPRSLVAFGEIGLAGEIRPVGNGEERLREAAKHGFCRALVARANRPKRAIEGLEVIGLTRLGDALEYV